VGQRSLKIIENDTIWKFGYGFLFVSHFVDIQRQRTIWSWNLGLGSFKVIENSSDVNKTKFLRPRPRPRSEQQDQDEEQDQSLQDQDQDQDQSDKDQDQDRTFTPRLLVQYTYCLSSKQIFLVYLKDCCT